MITIYEARKILTMNPARPVASHVAVRDGLIVGAGALPELTGWGEHRLDRSLADKVLMPGLVEGHSHVAEGSMWRFVYCGYFDRTDPDGKTWRGAKSIDDVIARLQEANTAPESAEPLTGWALDPIYFDNRRMTRSDLDRVSTTRPIGIMHASGHIMNVNSKALELAGMLRKGVNHPGIPLDGEGFPSGEMKGPEPMTPLGPHVGLDRGLLASDEPGLRAFAKLCVRAGVTTAADLANLLPDPAVDMMLRVTGEQSFPARIVPLRLAREIAPPELVDRVVQLGKRATDRLRLGKIKIVVDGSIQGFSARLRAPGYYNGVPNGLWYIAPEQLREILERALAAGVQVHCHTNGDEATELVLDMLELALRKHPSPSHRFTLQHAQLANAAQFRRMRILGMCVNLFPNHHFYWGDQHYALTVGPERAERMNACATALANGVPMAIHSDAPVTPLGPLFTAWCAVNRKTASGRVLGTEERISVADALRTITLGAAYTLGLDGEIGSIECGKRADFAVLEDDPTEIGGERLKDVRIWGTVQAGRLFPCFRAMTARIPVTLISGYLGAGKTTLVNALLRGAGGRRLTVLVNDFGALPIDADLIEARDGNLISISGGCVCCSFGSDLIAAIMALRAGARPIDHLLIETSGVALPASIAQSLGLIPDLDLNGIVGLADAETVRERAADRYMSDTVLAQLAASDIIVLNKIDLVSSQQLAVTRTWLNEVAPRARVLPAEKASLPPNVILMQQDERQSGRFFATGHDTTQLATASFEISGNGDPEALARALAEPGLHLLRAKGLVHDQRGMLTAIHVMGLRSQVAPAPSATTGTGRLVCIALADQLDAATIAATIAACPPFVAKTV